MPIVRWETVNTFVPVAMLGWEQADGREPEEPAGRRPGDSPGAPVKQGHSVRGSRAG